MVKENSLVSPVIYLIGLASRRAASPGFNCLFFWIRRLVLEGVYIFWRKQPAMVNQEKLANPPEKSSRIRLRNPHSSFPRKPGFKPERTARNFFLLIALLPQ
jgi:hypothetical protein